MKKSLMAFLIDATAAFFIFQIVAVVLAYFCFLPFFPSYFVIWLLYYCGCFLSKRTTLGLSFFNSYLKDGGAKQSYVFRLVLRECFTSFPAVVLWLFSWNSIVALQIALLATVCLILTIWRKRLFRLKTVQEEKTNSNPAFISNQQIKRRKIIGIYGLLIFLGTGSFCLNSYLTGDKIIFEEKPIALRPRPTAHSVSKYTDFINANSKDINEYIKELYKNYDHVVLCERWHPECTQYDMIYDMVTSPYFADSISNVFTEIGNIEKREAFRRITATSFASDSLKEKALASFIIESQTVWLLWSNTNWFDFLRNMSEFNHNREKPVNVLFSDILWTDINKLSERDSVMAYNIINTINSDSIKKSLVIMNYRHAFMTPRNCGYYLQQAFPGRVANVMLNTFSFNICQVPSALQHGKWDVAVEQADKDRFAIDFQNSPFGDDKFDLAPILSWVSSHDVKYKDMFNGMIYCTLPAEQYAGHGFPYIFEQENQAKLKSEVAIMPGDQLSNYDFLKYSNLIEKGGNYLENFVYNLIYIIFILASILILIGIFIASIYYQKK
ncbi:MAG: hypothetical protein HDR88_00095 [Bacteroides sp.]|nr:hypothetical protein [Bacteroides sp.]